jgi:ABC-2 type transport system permease protein
MVIYMLWLRQIKRYFRSRARIVGSLGQPLLFLLALGFGLGPVFQRAGQGNYIQFLAPGVIAMTVLFSGIFNGIELIWDRQFGFLKETLVAPVPRVTIMIGRTLGGATTSVMQGMIVAVACLIVGFRPSGVMAIAGGLVFTVLIAVMFTALGTAIASVLSDFQGFQMIMNFLVMPLYFLSGAMFPMATAPAWMKMMMSIDPLTYGVDALRNVVFAGTMVQTEMGERPLAEVARLAGLIRWDLPFDVAIIALVAAVLASTAAFSFSKAE